MDQDVATSGSRVDQLLTWLETDPRNTTLLAEAAEAALTERRPDLAADLLGRYAAIAPLPPRELNLQGLAALQSGDHPRAAEIFRTLFEAGSDDVGVRFNLAWAHAVMKDHAGALELLDEASARALPQAAMLHIQLLHELGDLDRAAELAHLYVELHPKHRGLMAAVSVLALDVEDEELAARCARQAGDHPDALAALGTLALGEERATEALDMFDQALGRNPQVPRAWVGRGLAKLLTGQTEGAPADIDKGAEMFGDHLGSWIAAGWAHFVNRDLASARARFETALQLDPNFAESHGSLAVLDLLDGRPEEARQRSEVALRLDRHCYSAALARTLLASSAGDQEGARRIFDLAVNTPVDDQGRTIGQALARLGISAG